MIQLRAFSRHLRLIPLRRPFRFGIAQLNELEHVVFVGQFEIDGQLVEGRVGENMSGRWFVKDPSLTLEEENRRLRTAISTAARFATDLTPAKSPFDFWWALHQRVRGEHAIQPPLAAQLAEAMLERAAINAWCKHFGMSLADALAQDRLGVRLEVVRPELAGMSVKSILPARPAAQLAVRHTVGLADDIAGLPSELAPQGVRRLKVKLSGNVAADIARLIEIGSICEPAAIELITLDGNENYQQTDPFDALLDQIESDPRLSTFAERLGWVEQPMHRDLALNDSVRDLLARRKRWRMVIDESDASPDDLPRALELGYAGATHKCCKGIFKSLLHAAQRKLHPGQFRIFSAEDLTIVAPWSQSEDLIVAAVVGVVDVERNGQHFADGLCGFDPAIGEKALATLGSMYKKRVDGAVELRIESGMVAVPRDVMQPELTGFSTLADDE